MLQKAKQLENQLINWRRDFHMHPELGFQEVRTSARVAQNLEEMGWRVRTGVGRTGVVAELGQASPMVAIRADMDALPIEEATQAPYASQNAGVMHACGHDAHTAMLLGVARLLAGEQLPGAVRLLFQPAEEVADDEGLSGAQRMIQDGAMQGVDLVLALHVDAHTQVGNIRTGEGPASGGVDTFFATIFGKGGHGARPFETIDPLLIASQVLMALYAIPSRRLDPFDPAVVSIGSLHGGQAANVIPDQVEISGTIRFMHPEVQKQIHTEIRQAFELARTMGGDYKLEFEIGVPPMINAPEANALIRQAATDLLGKEHVLPPLKGLGAEDFGCFSQIAPGAMFGLGCRIEGDPRYHHHPRFDIDERCLPIGAAILAQAALRFLTNEH
ncbi:MAG: amidohydrolase [Anaerolineales bacterium]|nr:amidohydrolase [Anaerolineales bacterium]